MKIQNNRESSSGALNKFDNWADRYEPSFHSTKELHVWSSIDAWISRVGYLATATEPFSRRR